eukprot:UN04440
MFKDMTFVCHLISDTFNVGFYWTLKHLPGKYEKYEGIKIKYQLQCPETNSFWHFTATVANKERVACNRPVFDGYGWPFDEYGGTLQTKKVANIINNIYISNKNKNKINSLHFICLIIEWFPMETHELGNHVFQQADPYYLK